MAGISGSNSYGSNAYNNASMLGDADGVAGGGGGAGSASDRAAAVAEATFQESLKAKMITGLYAAAKEIRS